MTWWWPMPPLYKSADRMCSTTKGPFLGFMYYQKFGEIYDVWLSKFCQPKPPICSPIWVPRTQVTYDFTAFIIKLNLHFRTTQCVVGVCLELSKAFDTVDYLIKLQKLYQYFINYSKKKRRFNHPILSLKTGLYSHQTTSFQKGREVGNSGFIDIGVLAMCSYCDG